MSLTVEQGKKIITDFCRQYPLASQVQYKVRSTQEEIFHARATIEKVGKIYGAYFPARNIAGFATANFRDEDQFRGTLRHEILGHFGLNTFSTHDKKRLLTAIIAAKDEPSIKPLWSKVEKFYPESSDALKAEEIYAFVCEDINPNLAVDKKLGEQSFKDSCQNQSKNLKIDNVIAIASMVASGFADGSRQQQIFPKTDMDLFQIDTTMKKAKKPFHEEVAQQIIKHLEEGTAPWIKPWKAGEWQDPHNPISGNRYRGINNLILGMKGFSDSRWMTYNQAQKEGWQVLRDEKSTTIQYWKFSEIKNKTDKDNKPILGEDGKPVKITVKLERPKVFYAKVFNAEQIEGIPPLEIKPIPWNVHEKAEKIIANSGANINHDQSDRAFYRSSTDKIHMPDRASFETGDAYYATLLHELGHWTGHDSRLNRELSNPFGSEAYAKEELRAEISSFMFNNELGLGHDPSQHVSYVASWIKVLKKDPTEIFRAARDAEKIRDYIVGLEQAKTLEVEQDQALDEPMPHRQFEKGLEGQNMAQDKPIKIYLEVPYADKDKAKSQGAKWDRGAKSWYINETENSPDFEKWLSKPISSESANQDSAKENENQAPSPTIDSKKVYLAVPFDEKEEAKKLGAKWNKESKSWYVPSSVDASLVSKWMPDITADRPALLPVEEYKDSLIANGFIFNAFELPEMDGKMHRVRVEGDSLGQKSGAYVGYTDGKPAGFFENHRSSIKKNWKSVGTTLTPEQRQALTAEAEQKRLVREAQREISYGHHARRCQQLWSQLRPAKNNEYLKIKGVDGYDVRQDKQGRLVIPLRDDNGDIVSIQRISNNGFKSMKKGAKKSGSFHTLNAKHLNGSSVILVAEGYSTAATLAKATNMPTVAAIDAGNLPKVAAALKAKYPNKDIVICGDDDRHNEKGNKGREKAEEAAKLVGAIALFPRFFREKNQKLSDWNDLYQASGLDAVKSQLAGPLGRLDAKHTLELRSARKAARSGAVVG